MTRLRQQLGPEGFNFMVPIDPETGFFLNENEDELFLWDDGDDGILDIGDYEFIESSDDDR